MALIAQEVSQGALDRDPRAGARDLRHLAAHAAVPRAAPGEGARTRPARIYYKYESAQPAGSHKPNTAVPQAYYNKREGINRLTTETGAGQWGSSLAFACALFGLDARSTWSR